MKHGKLMYRSAIRLNEEYCCREMSIYMSQRNGRVQRQGQVYRFSIEGADYAAFVWALGAQYRGRIDGYPQVPECSGRTALAVRDALRDWLMAHPLA